jgi:DNA-binding response OmpR family regulator
MVTQRILVVEDDAVLRNLLQRVLLADGYQVQAAANGQHALELLVQPFDAALVDLGLPDVPGLDVCRAVRARLGSVPAILVMSGNTATSSARAALDAGANDYLLKPFTLGQVKTWLRTTLPERGAQPA